MLMPIIYKSLYAGLSMYIKVELTVHIIYLYSQVQVGDHKNNNNSSALYTVCVHLFTSDKGAERCRRKNKTVTQR